MISEIVVGEDEAHFPIVSWTESRGHRAAGGPGVVEVECRIMKDADGVLLFAVRGAKRRGLFLDARPWETLQGFSIRGARDLYETPNERALEELAAHKSRAARLARQDSGRVIVANCGTIGLHINDADAAHVELEQLHFILEQHFVIRRRQLVDAVCQEDFRWPIDDDKVETITEMRPPDQASPDSARMTNRVFWPLLTIIVAALIAWSMRLI